MKKFKGILVLIVFVLLTGIISVTIILNNYSINDIDIVEINKIVNETRNSWDNLDELNNTS